MTDAERKLIRHALGADSDAPGYRNRFAATPGSPDDAAWAAMVASGLAYGPMRDTYLFGPLNFYAVTEAGQAAVGILETP